MVLITSLLFVMLPQVYGLESRSWLPYNDKASTVLLLNLKAYNIYNESQKINITTWPGIVYDRNGGWVLSTAHQFAPYIHIRYCTDSQVCKFEGIGFSVTSIFHQSRYPRDDDLVYFNTLTVNSGETVDTDQNVFFHPQVLASISKFYQFGKHLKNNVIENLRNHLISTSNDIVTIESKNDLFWESIRLNSPLTIESIASYCYALTMSKQSARLQWDYNTVVDDGDNFCQDVTRPDSLCAMVEREKNADGLVKSQKGCEDVFLGPLLCVDAWNSLTAVGMAKSCVSNGTRRDKVHYVTVTTNAGLESWMQRVMTARGYFTMRSPLELQMVFVFVIIIMLFIRQIDRNYKFLFACNIVQI